MSNQGPENTKLIKFIAETVKTMGGQLNETRNEVNEMRHKMVTKDDLEKMATKSDVESLSKEVESLSGEVSFIAGQVDTVRDQMATKDDIAQLEDRFTTKLEVQITAVRGDVEQVNLRLDSIDRSIRGRVDQIETEMSRMRSVLYLLVKDRPDMLRLLGQIPPISG